MRAKNIRVPSLSDEVLAFGTCRLAHPEPEPELERVARIYERYGRSRRKRRAWSATNPGNVAIRAELLEALSHAATAELEGDVLDAGCGGGHWLARLIEIGSNPERLHGADIQPDRISAAQASLPAAVDVRQADVRTLPYADSSFDAVLLLTVLSSLRGRADVRKALDESLRVTRTGGVVLIYEPRYPSPLNRGRIHVPSRLLRHPDATADEHALTAWPPIARRLGRLTAAAYPRLARHRWGTSHRLVVLRKSR
jgi:ubiquinone/menaquinone biosynthesis C-methylase UbiE